MLRIFLALIVSASLAGCSVTPREGPLSAEIEEQSTQNDYLVIDVNSTIVDGLARFNPVGLHSKFKSTSFRQPLSTVGTGDILAITVFEADNGGLFTGSSGNRAEFPQVVVDNKGEISLPYSGTIKVKGKTPLQIQDLVVERLQGKAIQPQAMVNVVRNENNVVTLSGDVTKPGLYPLSSKGVRLLDVVAQAGGTKFPARETYITLMRGARQGVQLLENVIDQPNENIYVARGDRIYLSHDPQRYTVLGAVQKPSVYTFDSSTISVLEAIAAAGGLNDNRADATGVFVFRYEDPKVLDSLNISYSHQVRGKVPTIYRINMQHAESYFYAQSFHLQDKDSVFVSNARAVEIGKILQLMNLATSSVRNIATTGNKIDVFND
ncbi:polysaccharide biosynthesis/export family protein [uncultured Cohaesibacter sp.]|uniref:polysaccharide biosynthesis/export family protein n=1 Tax=uncultured Cohaesibacter sp. TaxID=1002546 RepID=UPI002AA85EF6|nr:polysaccharide biosynthesis/export family protein [uncultured Cohaesibacter sp.]